jgi:hypothetical protein
MANDEPALSLKSPRGADSSAILSLTLLLRFASYAGILLDPIHFRHFLPAVWFQRQFQIERHANSRHESENTSLRNLR